MKLPSSWTTVTPLSKTIAMIIFVILPIISFFFGVRYQQKTTVNELTSNINTNTQTTPLPKVIVATPTLTGWNIHFSPYHNLVVQYPPGWKSVTEPTNGTGLIQIFRQKSNGTDDYARKIEIWHQESTKGETLESLFPADFKERQKILIKNDTEIRGIIVLTHDANPDKDGALLSIIKHKNTFYFVELYAPKAELETYIPTFDKVIKSMTFTE